MKVKVVIGANYGDEGKGLVTNFFTTQSSGKVLNVLHNGGCQRGHTVVTNGKRHVFHCFGSGTLNGAETYYHKNFLVDPIAWTIEVQQLKFSPKLWVDLNCRVVTPYDIQSNRIKELARGNKKHGSCGLGIFETITRHKAQSLIVADLFNEIKLYNKLKQIEKYYQDLYSTRAEEFPRVELDEFFRSVHLFVDAVETTLDCIYENYDTIIFEGGQGLRLDQDNLAEFPYLTPSSTGSAAIAADIQNLRKEFNAEVEVCYVTRPYLTRHGMGPLKYECQSKELSAFIVDKTNQPNPWQDSIRYAPIELKDFIRHINKDMAFYNNYVTFSLALTQAHLAKGKIYLSNNEMGDLSDIALPFDIFYTFDMERIDKRKSEF